MSEETDLEFARYHLDEACGDLMWAIRRLQRTGFCESQPDTGATLLAMYNSVVGVYREVDEYIEGREAKE